MGQYSALSDDFIIIAVSKAIVNSKTEKVEKYRRISRVVIRGQCLHRPLLFDFSKPGAHPWERRGASRKMQRLYEKSKKPAETFVSTGSVWSGRRGSNSLPPPWQGGALPDELRPHKKITENLFGDFFVGCPSPT